MKKAILILGMFALWAVTFAYAAPPDIKRLDGSTITTAEIDETVTRLMKAAEVTGAAVAILNDGKVAYLKAYGVRDKEKNLPLTADSVMTGASFTKAAFAYMVMQLVQEKLIDLDEPVYRYLPKRLSDYAEYADLANDPRQWKITARMLLSHTSGFANLRYLEPDRKLRIHFEPGSRYAYSGEGIQLLQLVVETITKKSLAELTQARVFQPLGMTRTSMTWEDRFESNFSNGYDEYGRSLGAQRRRTADAAGSLQTTPRDFALFMSAMVRGQGLSEETRLLMLSPQIAINTAHQFPTLASDTTDANKSIHLSYGLGWGLYSTPFGEAFFKEGHDEGWRNYTVGFPGKKIGIVIMTNSSNGEGIFKELLETLLKNTFTPIEWEGYTPYNQLPPRKPLIAHKEIAVDVKVLERYVGRYGEPPNLILTIRRVGNHLTIQENDEPAQELGAESETRFFSKSSTDSLTFELDGQGRAIRMIFHLDDGKNLPFKRIE